MFFFKEDQPGENLVNDVEVNYTTKNKLGSEPSGSVELIELMRFKINTLEKELNELRAKSKQDQ